MCPGDRPEHLAVRPDRQRAQDADQAGRLLPLHDLLRHRDIQVGRRGPWAKPVCPVITTIVFQDSTDSSVTEIF